MRERCFTVYNRGDARLEYTVEFADKSRQSGAGATLKLGEREVLSSTVAAKQQSLPPDKTHEYTLRLDTSKLGPCGPWALRLVLKPLNEWQLDASRSLRLVEHPLLLEGHVTPAAGEANVLPRLGGGERWHAEDQGAVLLAFNGKKQAGFAANLDLQTITNTRGPPLQRFSNSIGARLCVV